MQSATKIAVMPAVIIGGGRVGQALKEMGVAGDVVVRRGEAFPSEPKTGPIFVATRNDVLEDVIANTPPERREDLVFMQNGMLQPFLDARGLGANTQCLIYFAVAKAGEKPTDGITDLNPEGLTAVTGKWADAVAARFNGSDLSCHVLDASTYEGSMYEKLIWICAMMLVGAQHEGAKVGDVATTYKDEVVALIEELMSGLSGVKFAPGAVDRLIAYAKTVAHFPCGVKEFQWRNGFFYELSQKAIAAGKPDPFPIHTRLLKNISAV